MNKISSLKNKMTDEFEGIIYKSLDSVLEFLKRPQYYALDPVRRLLDIYHKVLNEETIKKEPCGKQFPFIVLEGLDGCGKSTISKILSNRISAETVCTPPKCIHTIRNLFDGDSYKHLRPAYYALGNYIAALQISTMVQHKPVVLDRFWHSTAAFAIAQTIQDYPEQYRFPPANNFIYKWPQDLLSPDIVILLNVDEHVRLRRIQSRQSLTTQEHLLKSQVDFRSNVILAYKRFSNPAVIIVDGGQSKKEVTECIMDHLQRTYPVTTLENV